ncbi:MAG: serine/threonine protein kinase [Solirubrobacterales bacterium]|nr:serine/threonine protein kinase [Solirubrobacterales bacterium]
MAEQDSQGDPEAQAELEPGSVFAGHRIESELGRGGMGVVYRTRHLTLDRETALKLIWPELSSQERLRARFRREARAAAPVRHPNVVSVHNAGEEAGRLYLSMQFVDGTDLGELVEHEGALEPELVATLVEQIAAGLDAAHARGLIHRDLKPSNVLVDRGGSALVSDFGISQIAGADAALHGSADFLDSPDYVAPEQLEGTSIDRRADVYALGGVIHMLLTGEPPFPRRSAPAKLVAHAVAERPRPSAISSELPAAIDEAIEKAMAVDPDGRFPSAGELAVALSAAVGAELGASEESSQDAREPTASEPEADEPPAAPPPFLPPTADERNDSGLPLLRGSPLRILDRRALIVAALLVVVIAVIAVLIGVIGSG